MNLSNRDIMQKTFTLANSEVVRFRNNTCLCIGTGRMGLALQKEYFEQLKLVQENIDFKWIRGHGLFNEDMAIYQEYKTEDGAVTPEYNFTYLDLVIDSYLELGIRPFIELGFMPHAIASGDQSVFYWRGNVTPPKDYALWNELTAVTLRHLINRYGADEVTSWPVEVWNEPNLAGFWKDADRKEYFKLFRQTILTIKSVDKRFRVGGPAICGVDDISWLKDFLNFCRDEKIPIDFVTRHLYNITPPERIGRYGYPKLSPLSRAFAETDRSREIIDSYPEYRGYEMHVTEFNTSYSPRTPLHDTNLNAAYIAYQLSCLGDTCESYSYWTFGDIFEETGVPFTPFHGGFGLVANGKIFKPTYWAFKFFKDLGDGVCIHRSEDAIVLKKADGTYRGIAWNIKTANGNSDKESDVLKLCFKFESGAFAGSDYCVVTKTVDEDVCNPLKVWHDIGEPANPSPEQRLLLRESSSPLIKTQRGGGAPSVELALGRNALVYFEIFPAKITSDRGFDYERSINVEFAD
jgi:xylan 1,4-beta-xylosidase